MCTILTNPNAQVQDHSPVTSDLDLGALFANLTHLGALTDTPANIQQRARRAVKWAVGEWRRTGFEEETVDIAAAINGAVQSPSWQRGSTLVVVLYGTEGGGVRLASAHPSQRSIHASSASAAAPARVTHLRVRFTPANVSESLSNASTTRDCNLTVRVSTSRQLARCVHSADLAQGRRVQAIGGAQAAAEGTLPSNEQLATLTSNRTVVAGSGSVHILSPIDLLVPLSGSGTQALGGVPAEGRIERVRVWWDTPPPPYTVDLLVASTSPATGSESHQWTTVYDATGGGGGGGGGGGLAGPTDILIASRRLHSSFMRMRIGNGGAAAADGTWVKLLDAAYYRCAFRCDWNTCMVVSQ